MCSLGSIFPSCKPPEIIFKITFWLGYLNSCINPVIYPCFSREFKNAFQNMLRGRCLRAGQPQGHITPKTTCPSSSDPTSNISHPSAQEEVTDSSWCCCRALSALSPSVGGPDQAQSAQMQSKSFLKVWCSSASPAPEAQNSSTHGSAKVLHLSLGVKGEAV